MDHLMVVLLSICYILFGPKIASGSTFDVTSYGAIGDGTTDDLQAFIHAWADVCGDSSPDPTLIIPPSKTFLVSPVAFNGPCKSSTLHIQLQGNIIAPLTLDGWNDCPHNQFWLEFRLVQGLTIDGPGQFDGQGSIWWGNQALHFNACNGLRLRGTRHINSPKLHISIIGCKDVDLGNLQILAPGNSPNTDGINIGGSSHVNIHDSTIQTGDDCVAINGGIMDLNVSGVLCGPGHGISIGSLGENGRHDTVEQVRVEHCNITGTTNGLRIKTVPNGTGYARDITFQDIFLQNVRNPILIDQHYCSSSAEFADCSAPPSAPAVQVSDVRYMNIHGSSATKKAINFNCSGRFKCTGIVTNNVKITGDGDFAFCNNTVGNFIDTVPIVTCD
ncbi:hypothetical protein L2E82_05923 [Cichorium intybus]|uniref:Uncharacterized protein n=1 Tax=Cichorium intybus TaxID=13427 RepID=A0ACB9H851_CICIN|nr:hypothetical protein L2E82_05923 [Cichorium intybus]